MKLRSRDASKNKRFEMNKQIRAMSQRCEHISRLKIEKSADEMFKIKQTFNINKYNPQEI